MSISTKILIGIIVLLIVAIVVFYIRLENLKEELKQKEDTILVLKQNEQALEDQVKMKSDSLQNYAVFVENLQKENKEWKNKYLVLKSQFQLLIDSLRVVDDSATVEIRDSLIIVTFSGDRGKVSYIGNTKYNVIDSLGTHTIDIYIEPVEVYSELYIDSVKILRQYIYADGVLINNAKTFVDSSVYLAIQDRERFESVELGFFDKVGVFAEITYYSKIQKIEDMQYGKLYFGGGLYYQFNDNVSAYLYKYLDDSNTYIGLTYSLSAKELINKIFK